MILVCYRRHDRSRNARDVGESLYQKRRNHPGTRAVDSSRSNGANQVDKLSWSASSGPNFTGRRLPTALSTAFRVFYSNSEAT